MPEDERETLEWLIEADDLEAAIIIASAQLCAMYGPECVESAD